MDWETVSHQGLNITLLLVVSELIHEGKMIKRECCVLLNCFRDLHGGNTPSIPCKCWTLSAQSMLGSFNVKVA
ncbi:unnamed protein product [Caretta caretta]